MVYLLLQKENFNIVYLVNFIFSLWFILSIEFIYHLLIFSVIFYIFSTGFKFFLQLKWTLDFSYMAIIIFWSYCGSLLNIHFGTSILTSVFLTFFVSIFFTLFILFLSSKLDTVYFAMWTFAIYILFYQLALNMEFVTGGTFWLTGMSQEIIFSLGIDSIQWYFVFTLAVWIFIIGLLTFIKRTFFFKVLQWWWENVHALEILWFSVNIYKFFMIFLTTFLAILWGVLYSFYIGFIDPPTFFIPLLITLLAITFISYKFNDFFTLIASIFVVFSYEYLRFFKIVDPTHLGYFREMFFSFLIMVIAFIVFKKVKFWREV
jgi:branched-chain amino acid transport system permease protein